MFSCALKMLTRSVHKDVRSYHIVSLVETVCFSGETFCFHCRNKKFPLFMLMRNKLEQTESQTISSIICRIKSRKKHKGCIDDDLGVCSIHPLIECNTDVYKHDVGMYRQIENFLWGNCLHSDKGEKFKSWKRKKGERVKLLPLSKTTPHVLHVKLPRQNVTIGLYADTIL